MPSIRSNIETSRFKKRARFVLPKRNGNELVRNRNRHGTRRFDSRYDERITRFTVISSHLTICRVFAVIKPRVSLTWIPFHVKRETYISWRIKPWQRLVMEYTGWICVCVRACIAVFVIPAWTGWKEQRDQSRKVGEVGQAWRRTSASAGCTIVIFFFKLRPFWPDSSKTNFLP